jgi:type I restriction enzyme S subunit
VLAPLNEQKRIADKLDAVLARVDASLGRLDRIPAILKRFRQSALSAATQGALTEDWRFANELKEPESAVLGENCDVLGGKRLPKGFELTDQNTGFPYVRVTDFATFSVKTEQLKYVPIEAVTTIKKYIISSGDIYISIAGSIGSVGQVPETISGSNLTENAARIIVRDGFLSKYLMYQLASPELQAQMHAKKIATTQDKLGLFRIKELELIKPSFEEQTEIVRRLESLFAYADRLEARYNTARTQVEKLTPALLAKAFRGELIPQDPNDEPASELLARIAAGKTAEQAKTRAGKRQIKPS